VNTDPAVALNATFSPVYPPVGRLAMLSQSGALGLAILAYARRLNIGFSSFVSIGNKADVSGNDLIQYWAEDSRTDVILLYLESFGNPRKFGQLARRITRSKPIVALKSGRSNAGARAASSHTGALAATDTVVDGLFRQAGVIRTNTMEELFDVAVLLAHQPLPAGRRVAVLTNAGGPGILAADECEGRGLQLPPLSDQTVAELRSFLPAAASVANPVDMLASAPPEHFVRAMKALLRDGRVDSLIVIFIPPLITDPDEVAAAIVEGATSAGPKPVLATFMSARGAPDVLSNIPSYVFPEAAAAALATVTTYGEWRRRPLGTIPKFDDIKTEEIREVIGLGLGRGGGWLHPAEVERLFAACGIPLARSRNAASADEAVLAATEIGFPVVLKAVGPTILHKTEVGGVALSLKDAAGVIEACDRMIARLGVDLVSFVVQEMVPGGVEVVVGATVDPTFGPVVLYGSGGILIELLADVSCRIHPLTDIDVESMLEEVKGTVLLRGYRGTPPSDEAVLREVIHRVSSLLELAPEIQEMDLNPVEVLKQGVRAVDARVRVERLPEPRPSRRIAY
ncbi:MAG: acetate--CoA ligase family protein, partial [Acidobacteria bacterium]|nr:acetate--CoA ligase family protein [Acidobacteriota bacterium]